MRSSSCRVFSRSIASARSICSLRLFLQARPFGGELGALLLEVGETRAGLLGGQLRLVRLFAGAARLGLEARERRVGRLPFRAEALFRGRKDARRQARLLRHGERARAPAGARPHAERGPAGLLVELHRGREDARPVLRPLLHGRKVRRRDRDAAAREILLEDGDRERRAFVGVRAAAELVDEHEAPRRRLGEDARRARHRRRERREVAEEILRVARDDEHLVEDGERRARRGRDREARLREEREEADGLHRDALAARVRAGQEEKARSLGQLEVQRHRVGVAFLELSEDVRAEIREAPVEKGMARPPKDEPVRKVGEHAGDARREFRARLIRVQLGEHLDGGQRGPRAAKRTAP